MLSEPQVTVLLQRLNEVNEEVGAEYELRRLEAAYCTDFNKNRVCTKPDSMAKNLTRQLVIEDAIQDNVRIEHIITGLQQEAETRAEETAKLEKLIAFWSAYTVDFIKNKTAGVNTESPALADPTNAVVSVSSDAMDNAVSSATDATDNPVSRITDATGNAVSVTTDATDNTVSLATNSTGKAVSHATDSTVAAVNRSTDDDDDDASPSVAKEKNTKCRSS